jgi:ABC-type multidrug transport system permease subunit
MDESSGLMPSGDEILNSYHLPRPLPLWLNSQYAKHIVRGNFMTLSARPKTVEQGEWIAHHGKRSNHLANSFRAYNGAKLTLRFLYLPQSLNITEIFGTLLGLFMKRKTMALVFATRYHALERLLARMLYPGRDISRSITLT